MVQVHTIIEFSRLEAKSHWYILPNVNFLYTLDNENITDLNFNLKQKEQLSRSKFAKRIPWSQTQFQKSLRWLWKQIELFPWILWCACAFFLSTVEAEAQARWNNLKTGGDHFLGPYFGTKILHGLSFWAPMKLKHRPQGNGIKIGWN